MTDTRTTATDDPTTLPVDAMRTTDTDDPTGVPMLDFGTAFGRKLETGEGIAVRIPELVNVNDTGTIVSRPLVVTLLVDQPDRLLLTAVAVNGKPVLSPVDLKPLARISPVEEGIPTEIALDVAPDAQLPIDLWIEAAEGDGPIRVSGDYTTISEAEALIDGLQVNSGISVPPGTAVAAHAVDVIPSEDQAQLLHAEPPERAPEVWGANPPTARPRRVLGQPVPGIEPVPASEANAPAGLLPHPNEGEREIRLILVGAAKAALHKLIDGITEETAARNLSQIGKTALDLRKTLARFGMHAFPEEEVLSARERKMRRLGARLGGRGLNRETMGVTAIKEMVGAFTTFTKPAELDKAISSLARMKDIDDPEGNLAAPIAQLEAKVIELTKAVTSDPGVDVDAIAEAAGVAMTGAVSDVWEGGIGLGGAYSSGGYIGDSMSEDDYDDEDDMLGAVPLPVAYSG